MIKTALVVLGALISAMAGGMAAAQDGYPRMPVKIVLGFPPGGATDLVSRALAQKFTEHGVGAVVENRAGANGNIGAEFVARAPADGHTLLYNTSGVILSTALGEKMSYDVLKDLAPISLVATVPLVLTVHPSVPANTPAEFIAYVRANPDKLAYGSSGNGNITHLASVLFLQAHGLTALHVPYKATANLVADATAGRLQFLLQTSVSSLPPVKDKRIRALAVTSLQRIPLYPDVPTLNETVMPKFELGAWSGLMGPAKLPPVLVRRLEGEVAKAMQSADFRARLAAAGAEPMGTTASEYGVYLRSELDRFTKVVKIAGIKPGE